jgi:hypothetical protein
MARRAVWRRRLRRRRRRRRRRRPTRRRCRSRAVDAIGVHDANRNVAHVGEVEGTQAHAAAKRLADKSRRRGRRRNRGSPFTDSGCRPDQQGRSHALAGRRAVLTCAFTCAKASTSRRTISRRTGTSRCLASPQAKARVQVRDPRTSRRRPRKISGADHRVSRNPGGPAVSLHARADQPLRQSFMKAL